MIPGNPGFKLVSILCFWQISLKKLDLCSDSKFLVQRGVILGEGIQLLRRRNFVSVAACVSIF